MSAPAAATQPVGPTAPWMAVAKPYDLTLICRCVGCDTGPLHYADVTYFNDTETKPRKGSRTN